MPTLTCKVNGRQHTVTVKATSTLLEVLRDQLGITSPKTGCNTGDCGVCSVLINGRLVKSCITNALTVHGQEVTTLEGIAEPGTLDPLQKAFDAHNASQCGYCTPGMIMAAKALLLKNPNPTRTDVKEALAGNLCRCTGYAKIIDAVMDVAGETADSDNIQ